MLLHFPPCTKGIEGEMTWCNTHRQEACSECDNIKAQWTAMLDAYAAGKYKAIGVSNCASRRVPTARPAPFPPRAFPAFM